MKLFLQNTTRGLVPLYDADYDEKRKLKIGQVYSATIRLERNYEFHKKYFALIGCAWEFQNEKAQKHFKNNVENFRKTIEIASGHCDTVYNLKLKSWTDIPKSISFDKMDNSEFQELYERTKDVLFEVFLRSISKDEFLTSLANF